MGGAEKVERHRAQGKLTVRERIDALLDPGSFREVGALTGRTITDDDGTVTGVMPANFVMGRGRIDDRPVVVGGDDFTVRGGAADASIFQKQVMAERMAHDFGLPDRPPRRRLRRRRQRQDARDRAAVVRAVQPGLGVGRRQPRAGCRW